jgi:hypothetical protein
MDQTSTSKQTGDTWSDQSKKRMCAGGIVALVGAILVLSPSAALIGVAFVFFGLCAVFYGMHCL